VNGVPLTQLLTMLGTTVNPTQFPVVPGSLPPAGSGSAATPPSAQEILRILAQKNGPRMPGRGTLGGT
jgi:hypothetical protein